MNGLLVLDKPSDWTSHDVVSRVRRVLGTRKVGHAGTLDPMATGVLVLGVGRATRLLGYIAGADKSYTATIRLGQSTSTDDAQGELTEQASLEAMAAVRMSSVEEGIVLLTGTIMQVPSSVSAIKVEGKRAYAMVRSGEEVVLAPRKVEVTEFTLLDHHFVDPWLDLDVQVTCSSGTYIRALARDLGNELGLGGHLIALRRTRLGPWDQHEALSLEQLEAAQIPEESLLTMESAVSRIFPSWVVSEPEAVMVRNGRRIDWTYAESAAPIVAVYDSELNFLALAEQHGPTAKYLAVFV
ncbi:MAG: tRNA pseudouridine(55) synthase TruB [Actinomycetota bacterium]|nr:tRNA pseudouridine(55) synthase TruB [Actinomycetota bacterium]